MTARSSSEAVVAELKAAIPGVKWAAQQDYGRVSREAAYMLWPSSHLNAGVYTGTPMWAECAEACKMVMSTGIQLAEEYKYLFCASNDKYVGNGEILGPYRSCRVASPHGAAPPTSPAVHGLNRHPPTFSTRSTAAIPPGRVFASRPELSKALKGDKRRLIYEGTYRGRNSRPCRLRQELVRLHAHQVYQHYRGRLRQQQVPFPTLHLTTVRPFEHRLPAFPSRYSFLYPLTPPCPSRKP